MRRPNYRRKSWVRTSVTGRVVKLNVYDDLGLRDTRNGQDIELLATASQREELRQHRRAGRLVIVVGDRGFYGREVLTRITAIVPIDDAAPGSWREAVGSALRPPGGEDITSAEAVRRVRGAE